MLIGKKSEANSYKDTITVDKKRKKERKTAKSHRHAKKNYEEAAYNHLNLSRMK